MYEECLAYNVHILYLYQRNIMNYFATRDLGHGNFAHRHGTHPDSHAPVPASPGAFNGRMVFSLWFHRITVLGKKQIQQ